MYCQTFQVIKKLGRDLSTQLLGSSIVCLLLLITIHISYSQTQKLWVIDSLTGLPIEGVTMFANQNFYYSDSSGLIQAKVIPDGLIWFKRMDYEQKWLNYAIGMDTIRMVRKIPFLCEVTVTNKGCKNETFEVGYYQRKKFFKKTNICNNLCILAVYIPCYQENCYIDKILLSINSRKFAKDYVVYLYEPDLKGMPGKVLYQQRFVADSLKKEGIIDVSHLNIKVPNKGIFIGLENTKKYNFDELHPMLGMGVRFEYIESKGANLSFVLLKDLTDVSKNNNWFPSLLDEIPCFGLQVYQK